VSPISVHDTEIYLGDLETVFAVAKLTTPVANKLTVTIAAVPGKRHYLGGFVLTGTAGAGGTPTVTVSVGGVVCWKETFTVGTDLKSPFGPVTIVAGDNQVLVVEASATALTAGELYVVYKTR
jgi:hypothetical protein